MLSTSVALKHPK
jgi:hypothetical protein